jgi:hypothetical protein
MLGSITGSFVLEYATEDQKDLHYMSTRVSPYYASTC